MNLKQETRHINHVSAAGLRIPNKFDFRTGSSDNAASYLFTEQQVSGPESAAIFMELVLYRNVH